MSRPNPIFLKRRHITRAVASSSGNIGFVGVCDFKLGKLTNNVSKEIHAENGKKWQWAAEKCYMKILMTRWCLSFILLSCERNQVSRRTCASCLSNLFLQTGQLAKISKASAPQRVLDMLFWHRQLNFKAFFMPRPRFIVRGLVLKTSQ